MGHVLYLGGIMTTNLKATLTHLVNDGKIKTDGTKKKGKKSGKSKR